MIDKTELRVGNQIINNGEIVTVSTIGETTFSCIVDGKRRAFNHVDAEPIPLTEEKLRELGWNVNVYVHKEGKRFLYYTTDDTFWFADESFEQDEKREVVCKIEYVHEAQNLIYALYKEELQVNL